MKIIYSFILSLFLLASHPLRAQLEVRLKPLPKEVNSPYDELSPIISGDGNTLFFVRGNHPDNVGFHLEGNDYSKRNRNEARKNRRPDQDIWYSERVNNQWTEAKNLNFPVNGDEFGVVCGTNYDGTKLYITHKEIKLAKRDTLFYYGPAILNKVGDEWGVGGIEVISVEGLDEMEVMNESHFYFHLSADEEHLFISMHSETEGTKGQEDLFYAAKMSDKTYSKPVLLKGLNSEGYETAPFLSKDGKKLYFSSNRSKINSINSDIYFSERKGNSWTQWSSPERMSGAFEDLNSRDFDAYLVIHDQDGVENYGFLSSARPSELDHGKMADIFEFDLIRKYNLEIVTVDARTGESLSTQGTLKKASQTIQNENEGNTQSRKYFMQGENQAMGEYTFQARADNYRDTSITFQIALEDYQLKKILPLSPETDLEKLDVPEFTVYFEFDRSNRLYPKAITPQDSLAILAGNFPAEKPEKHQEKFEELKKALEANPKAKIYLRGHADFIGNLEDNIALSKRRVNTVREFLKTIGIPADKIREDLVVSLGEGEAQQNADDDNRAADRKVEIFKAERSTQDE